jgi:hypothetical protein
MFSLTLYRNSAGTPLTQFGPNVNFIFECHELKFASPATVSRAGMIFLSEENIDIDIMLKSWLSKQPAAAKAKMEGCVTPMQRCNSCES